MPHRRSQLGWLKRRVKRLMRSKVHKINKRNREHKKRERKQIRQEAYNERSPTGKTVELISTNYYEYNDVESGLVLEMERGWGWWQRHIT